MKSHCTSARSTSGLLIRGVILTPPTRGEKEKSKRISYFPDSSDDNGETLTGPVNLQSPGGALGGSRSYKRFDHIYA